MAAMMGGGDMSGCKAMGGGKGLARSEFRGKACRVFPVSGGGGGAKPNLLSGLGGCPGFQPVQEIEL
jgi:signal recognition particle subunit SRP54